MTLSLNDRREIWAEWMRLNRESISVTKQDLRAALDAIDDWIDAQTASFNAAIPLPARTELSAAQKSRLFSMLLAKRFEVT